MTARYRGRIVLLVAGLVLVVVTVPVAGVGAQDDCGGLFEPPCPDEPTSTTSSTTTPTTEPPSTTATTGIATTVSTETTTTTTTTTTVATTEAAPEEPETTSATEPPAMTTTSAPPEAVPPAPTTTVQVGELRRITQNTPDLTGVMVLWILGLLGTIAVLAAGFYRNRFRKS